MYLPLVVFVRKIKRQKDDSLLVTSIDIKICVPANLYGAHFIGMSEISVNIQENHYDILNICL